MRLKNVKTAVFGIQGSGKTYLVENHLLKGFKHPFVYRVHKEDFENTKKNVYVFDAPDLSLNNLEETAKIIKGYGQAKLVDCFVLDEADLFLKSMVAISPNMTDLILNHRHYNLGLIFITRRPQSIPTEIVESCENLICFKIEGENVERKLRAIHPDFKILLPKLDKDKFNFILKELGKAPKIYNKIERVSFIKSKKQLNKKQKA
jgi:DNA helicase HerA-like ATPase